MKNTKAWAILDKETGTLARYFNTDEYMISPTKTDQKNLHKTYKCVQVEIKILNK